MVGKFVEFFGEGAVSLSVADRATIGNMAPEYGATIGFFPVDEKSLDYLRMTGRSEEQIGLVRDYLKAQGLFGIPTEGKIDYTKALTLDLGSIEPAVAGPKRPQDRIPLAHVKAKFEELLSAPLDKGGYAKSQDLDKTVRLHSEGALAQHSGGTDKPTDAKAIWSEQEMVANRPLGHPEAEKDVALDATLSHGTVVIAAITSCTNTSNPSVMIGAGLVAKKAVERGLKVPHFIKTSLAPGSRVVTDYLERTGLQKYLDKLGFQLVAYGCTTCIGNSGPLDAKVEDAIKKYDLIAASVLSGNRNFEARIHSSVKANFLMSPPLVVAFALAGRINFDPETEPLGKDLHGNPVYLREIWPSSQEIAKAVEEGIQPAMFEKRYENILSDNPVWNEIKTARSAQYRWDPKSTYIRQPPFFDTFSKDLPKRAEFSGMRALALLGDSVTTDHISPAGAFKASSPAGKYLQQHGIEEDDFNSYGSRRGNHEVMMRGTFANVRIRNKMADGKEGGFTKLMPEGTLMPIYDACQVYAEKQVPLILFAGKDYGMGSSRDWAAKGTALLGVKAVVAESFERIHRSNLIGMGVLPLTFQPGQSWESCKITGKETFALHGLESKLKPHQQVELEIDGSRRVPLTVSVFTPIEAEYYEHGGILPYVLRQILY